MLALVLCYATHMTLVPLKTYLRTFRKRVGLTHDEVAFLAGGASGTSVARHERGKRVPLLRTALMYELILRVPIRILYEGLLYDSLATFHRRIAGLCASLERQERTRARDRKIAHLKAVLEELRSIQS